MLYRCPRCGGRGRRSQALLAMPQVGVDVDPVHRVRCLADRTLQASTPCPADLALNSLHSRRDDVTRNLRVSLDHLRHAHDGAGEHL
jgi:hypothetical protein